MFTENQKLEDLLKINPQLILMLPRFKMDLGFGDKKVHEVCKEKNIPTSMFLTICNTYTFDYYTPTHEDLQEIDENILIEYLKISHNYYLNQRLTHIRKHIENIAMNAGQVGEVLTEFFNRYSDELKKHFQIEENTLFNKITNQEGKDESLNLDEIEELHSSICDHLKDLTNIIVKYLPADLMTSERISVWFDLTQLSEDLRKHSDIEEKILLPFLKLNDFRK